MKKAKSKIQNTTAIIMVALSMIVYAVFAQHEKWEAPAAAAKVKNPVKPDAASLAAAKVLYTKECSKCHGNSGMGNGPNASSLDKPIEPWNTADFKAHTDGELFWKITEGKKPMPSTKKSLSDNQRWQLVNYIRTFSSAKTKK